MKNENHTRSVGTVTTRRCPFCGHHEIGFTGHNGAFHPLKPGTRIQILEDPPALEASENGRVPNLMQDDDDPHSETALWIPEALRGDRTLRLKYGVMLKGLPEGGMSGDHYRRAFVRKLKRLTENESEIPIPVLLDKFFTAPHLAVGNPGQIAEALWSELDEIKRPVTLMNDWLEKQDDESFNAMIHPQQRDSLGHETIRDEDIMRELETLSLDEFLEWL